jgi:peptidoglycan/xylan/chitin deacetylase (PgdA/CDA1 family)
VDAGQIDELRSWGQKLSEDQSHPELQPAGRAILLLIDEVERLRAQIPTDEPPAQDGGGGGPAVEVEPEPEPTPRPRRKKPGFFDRYRRLAIAAVVLGALVFATFALGARIGAPSLDPQGPQANAAVGPARLPSLSFSVGADHSVLERVRWKLDGADVTGKAHMKGGRLVLDGNRLADGAHRVQASAAGGFPGSRTTKSWTVRVDTRGPAISFAPPGVLIPYGHPLALAGTLEPGATLTSNGRPVLVSKDGRFRLSWAKRPTGPITLVATDRLRNATSRRAWISLQPRRPAHPVRAVHVTFDAWADPGLHRGIVRLIDQGRINAVELDLKDESGTVGWNAPVPLAHRIGAVKPLVDLPAAVRFLHGRGVRVIGRLVCFRDPILAGAAWKAGRRGEVIQTPGGQMYGGYGGFTNFADPAVRRYQIDIAAAAAKIGVDDVLYDYVRRPDGPLSTMAFPGLKGTPEWSIASFLAETRAALKPYGTYLGASVFGVAATRPTEVAQDIPMMAQHVDYISPMVYPSHWAPGEYGVANPNAQPYDIVQRSLEDFQRDVRGSGARIVPWLQDFSLGVDYGRVQVEDEMRGARDAGADEYLLWDPAVTYTAAALPTNARTVVFTKQQTAAQRARALQPDELGVIPVLMHHQIRQNGSTYDLTAGQFRAELARLWRDGYYPVRASDLVSGRLDVPKGKTPVVMTFDDATNNQIAFLPDGRVDPKTAVGIFEDFAAQHPGFPATGTFYVPRNAFNGDGESAQKTFGWLVANGFELGNHTKDHIALNTLGATAVQRQLVLGNRLLTDRLPGYRAQTMALPLGALPHPASLAARGTWDGQAYRFAGVFLSGAEPAPSPFSTGWSPGAIPRILPNPRWNGARDFTWGMWLDALERNPQLRYVSDGNAETISFPRARQVDLAARYRDRAHAY